MDEWPRRGGEDIRINNGEVVFGYVVTAVLAIGGVKLNTHVLTGRKDLTCRKKRS